MAGVKQGNLLKTSAAPATVIEFW